MNESKLLNATTRLFHDSYRRQYVQQERVRNEAVTLIESLQEKPNTSKLSKA